ncbi:MAG: hypothetical protein NW203_03340 [Hyphomonadaceae bacterium]|nr:hypothetical protein [Hyphomonadaceae bacterium]
MESDRGRRRADGVTACATGAASTDLQFSPDSDKAIVVLGLEGLDAWRGMSVYVYFRGVDAAGAFDDRSFSVSNGNGWRPMGPQEYFVVDAEPGAYVVSTASTYIGMSQTITTFCLGTVRFEAPAGQAVYIGNFLAPRGGSTVVPSPPDFGAAAAKLREYANVQQSLTQAQTQDVPYPPSRACRS